MTETANAIIQMSKRGMINFIKENEDIRKQLNPGYARFTAGKLRLCLMYIILGSKDFTDSDSDIERSRVVPNESDSDF